MASTTFTDATSTVPGTPVVSSWLNDINSTAYTILGDGTSVPATKAIARTNLAVPLDGPKFRAHTGTPSALANSTVVQIPLEIENFDPSNSYNVATYRFQPTVAGFYSMGWSLGLQNTGASTLSVAAGMLFRTGVEASRTQQALPTGGNFIVLQGTDIVFLNGTTDYVDLRGFGTITTGVLNVVNGTTRTWLCGSFIGT